MDTATISYGGRQLTLRKSAQYIAVKPRPGAEHQALAAAGPNVVRTDHQGLLGGFRLLRVDAGTAGGADRHGEREPANGGARGNGAPPDRHGARLRQAEATLNALRAHPAVAAGTHVFETADDGVPFVPTGQLYVECAPHASPDDCQALLERNGLQIVEARGERELIVQVTGQSVNPVKTAAALQQSPLIVLAEPDLATPGRLLAFVAPSDPRILDQWHLRNEGRHRGTTIGFRAGADARVLAAWELAESAGSPNVVVAVIDDGFDLAHPDLTGSWKVAAPKDFTRNSASPIPDPQNQDWHGTACAGVAVGNADGTGIVGAAPRCRLMPVRWGRSLSDSQIESWFDYVREQGAWVVSCSWGADARVFPLSVRAQRAIARCAREGRGGLGTVICFAAGNEDRDVDDAGAESVNGFAIHPDVIAVAACTSRDQRSDYSNFGRAISLCAPSSGAGGWGITTSDVMGQYTRGAQTFEAGYSPGAYTDDFGGTSSATPLVAGVCALLLSLRPELRATEVRDLIQRTARRIGDPAGYDAAGHSPRFGHGCVNAEAAVAELLGQDRVGGPAAFWGKDGHEAINALAVDAIPDDALRAFYAGHAAAIEREAMAADHAKGSDAAERPRHYIDLDAYGEFPFADLPEDYDAAVAKFGAAVVVKRGLLPWEIARTYEALVGAFRAGDQARILRESAWLGHYVGDAHVPLHTTENHDGQLTGQRGLHGYFESSLLKQRVTRAEVRPQPGRRLTRPPHEAAFEWVRESYTYVLPILEADARHGGRAGRRDMTAFAKVAKPIAIDRLAKGCSRLAGLWLTAWEAAGRPEVPGTSKEAATLGRTPSVEPSAEPSVEPSDAPILQGLASLRDGAVGHNVAPLLG